MSRCATHRCMRGRLRRDPDLSPDRTALLRGLDRAVAAEPQAVRGRLGEVVLATGHVRPAVDDPDAHDAPMVAERDLGTAGERLVRAPEVAGVERAAAAEVPAVQAGPVPRGMRG